MKVKIASVLLLLLLTRQCINGRCPAQLSSAGSVCQCSESVHGPLAVVCSQAPSLNAALTALSSHIRLLDSLSILDTPIPHLSRNDFQGFDITRLVLNRNGLKEIDENAFTGRLSESLLELDLSENQLGLVPQLGVSNLRNLRQLYLNRNNIRFLHPNTFKQYLSASLLFKVELAGNHLDDSGVSSDSVLRPLTNLEEVSLETNALTSIPRQLLLHQRLTLKNLNLGLNQISNVPIGALDFPNLYSLSLEFNGIQQIDPEAFQRIPNLQYLYITGNRLTSWQPEMFRYIGQLKTLGIGETAISVIPSTAFDYIPELVRLEMSEAAVDTIEQGAFQRAPRIQAIVLNRNRLTQVPSELFDGLQQLYSVDLQANRLETVQGGAFARLPSLTHLDISHNQLHSLPADTFDHSFAPVAGQRRLIYACNNPWVCDGKLEWFRQLLRDNVDIELDKPDCSATCAGGPAVCFPADWPLRNADPICPINEDPNAFQASPALSLVQWIILAIIMAILLTSIVLLAFVRYGISQRRKKKKAFELKREETVSNGNPCPGSVLDINLPPANLLL